MDRLQTCWPYSCISIQFKHQPDSLSLKTIRQSNKCFDLNRNFPQRLVIPGRIKIGSLNKTISSPVSWGCRMYWLHLCWGVRLPCQLMSWIRTLKHLRIRLQSWRFRECEVPLHYHYSELHSYIVIDRVSSIGQIELFDQILFNHLTVFKQITDVELNCLYYIAILETF